MKPINEFKEFLINDFEQKKLKRPRFSMRLYAKKLGLAPATLSEFMAGKKNISIERAAKIIDRMELKKAARNKMLLRLGAPLTQDVVKLEEKDYDVLWRWELGAVLFSADLAPDYRYASKISEITGMEIEKVQEIIGDLVRRGFLSIDVNGQISRREEFLSSTDNISNKVLLRGHLANLDLAKRSLVEHPTEKRDFTALTFAGNREELEAVRAEIRALHLKISTLMSSSQNPTSIYRFSIQLFPLEFK